MEDDTTTVVRFAGGAWERVAWERLRDAAQRACTHRALGARRAQYHKRVEEELAALAELGLQPGVLLELAWVVKDLRARGVTFGPGYGPQCGSLLLHTLGLNGVDPLEHALPFLGFGRELEARRLHLRVASRAEQAELSSALRRYSRPPLELERTPGELEVVVGWDASLALTRELERMAREINGGYECDPTAWAYPWEDPTTLRLIARGETEGIAALEDAPLPERLRESAPRSLEEVVQVMVACREAAPADLPERYSGARSGAARPPLPHPELEEVLAPTAHLWLYREQVVASLVRLLGCDWRRAVALCEHLAEERRQAGEGAHSQQLAQAIAERNGLPHARGLYLVRALRQAIPQVVDRAAVLAEATEAYRQAYYKARYPAAFQAARLNAVLRQLSPHAGLRYSHGSAPVPLCPHREALSTLCRETVRDGITVLPPDINRSGWGFQALDRHTLLFGLGAIATVDRAVAERLVQLRRSGEYRSLQDLVARGFGGDFEAGPLEPLILAGALDGVLRDRWGLLEELEEARRPRRPWLCEASRGKKTQATPWGMARPREGWAFQRELDVLGCVPSRGYFPEPEPPERCLRPVK